MESVSVLVEHFGKLQDLLGNVFREMLVLSGEDACCLGDFSPLFPYFSHNLSGYVPLLSILSSIFTIFRTAS